LDLNASGAKYTKKGSVSFKELVLDKEKIINALSFFRVNEKKYNYIISLDLVKALRDAGVDNIVGTKLMVV